MNQIFERFIEKYSYGFVFALSWLVGSFFLFPVLDHYPRQYYFIIELIIGCINFGGIILLGAVLSWPEVNDKKVFNSVRSKSLFVVGVVLLGFSMGYGLFFASVFIGLPIIMKIVNLFGLQISSSGFDMAISSTMYCLAFFLFGAGLIGLLGHLVNFLPAHKKIFMPASGVLFVVLFLVFKNTDYWRDFLKPEGFETFLLLILSGLIPSFAISAIFLHRVKSSKTH